MTKNDAEELLKEIVSVVNESIDSKFVSREFADLLLEECLRIKVDDFRTMEFMIRNKSTCSIKPANIIIDLKKAIGMSIELFLTSAIPDSIINSIQLILLIAYKAVNLMKIELTSEMAEIVYVLHKLNAYEIAIPISNLHKEVEKDNCYNEVIHIDELNGILDKLKSNGIIDIIEDRVFLKERLFYIG